MIKRKPSTSPDFFAVLVLLVVLGIGFTVSIQVISTDTGHVVDSQPISTGLASG